MWDEKQFFEDFNKEVDTVNPDDEFVNRLKKLDDKKTIINIKRKKLTAVAACILILFTVGIGAFAISRINIDKPNNNEQITLPIHLGQDETTAPKEITMDYIVELLNDKDILVVDSDGKEISKNERAELVELLENAVPADSVTGIIGEGMQYIIKDDKDITVSIYFGEYVLVNEEDMYVVGK